MNAIKTTLAFVLVAGLNTAAFAQTTPTNANSSGTMQTSPGTNTTGTDVYQSTHGTPNTNNGTMRDGTMNADGTMRTNTNSSTRRTMKAKGNMSNGKGKMKDKPMN